ncbi:VPLPA-CTERM sorting domain-containing protein [Roseibacterium sp. SDUM158016]|uniref:VPLPA-CTERM sorting domain-containing protein n=1 Tax=Roseicyclus sediminis TaxID=2980997 RepID=UPI0021D13ACC|nr:VPLPA-CTERM sorting domain-containing protein [Roseibacterium sp. SDUM158016]MCU4653801.1 VPLPA-CTERM sorting domain-containing protein [Roseibacterium sp. SDUM158016]
MKRILAAAAASLFVAGPAAASTVTLDYVGPGAFGAPNLAQNVTIQSPVRGPIGVRAGPFHVTDGVSEFFAWCFDIAQNVADGVSYQVAGNPLGSAREGLLNRLFTSYYDDIDTGVEGAAFQVAIWEIVYENLSGPLDVSTGLFSAWNNSGVVAQANSWLSNLGQEENYEITYFASGTNQDLLTGQVAPVPLPAGILLLGSGLGAIAVTRRRRKTA